jgi:hypothetical protein
LPRKHEYLSSNPSTTKNSNNKKPTIDLGRLVFRYRIAIESPLDKKKSGKRLLFTIAIICFVEFFRKILPASFMVEMNQIINIF